MKNFIEEIIKDSIKSMAITAGSVIGLSIGGYIYIEKIEPWVKEKFNK